MGKKELRQYLKDVYELESQYYAYEEVISKYKAKIESRHSLSSDDSIEAIYKKLDGKKLNEETGYEYEITDCSDYKRVLERKADRIYFNGKTSNRLDKAVDIIFPIGYIIPIVCVVIAFFISGFGGAIGTAFLGAIFFIVCLGITRGLQMMEDSIREKNKKNQMQNILNDENKKANEHNELTMERLIEVYESAVDPHNEVLNLLDELYDQNIIHPKYRNLLAVSQFYEYFDTGRCTELEGPNGAYNLYESELRQNLIIDRLDTIISQLDNLNRTMGYVVSSINQSNMLLNNISSSLYRIEANTALTTYNTQCIATNTQIANRYGYTYH